MKTIKNISERQQNNCGIQAGSNGIHKQLIHKILLFTHSLAGSACVDSGILRHDADPAPYDADPAPHDVDPASYDADPASYDASGMALLSS